MRPTHFYNSFFFKNILLHISGRLSKVDLVHTYVLGFFLMVSTVDYNFSSIYLNNWNAYAIFHTPRSWLRTILPTECGNLLDFLVKCANIPTSKIPIWSFSWTKKTFSRSNSRLDHWRYVFRTTQDPIDTVKRPCTSGNVLRTLRALKTCLVMWRALPILRTSKWSSLPWQICLSGASLEILASFKNMSMKDYSADFRLV